MITAAMTVAEVLARHPQTLDVFVAQHSAFARLRNPLLRRAFARLVTVQQAAGIAGADAEALLEALNHAAGYQPAASGPCPAQCESEVEAPAWLRTGHVVLVLDVRDMQRRQEEPLGKIMGAVKHIRPGEILTLRNTFEPLPLYELMRRRGFGHWARQLGDEDWEIFLYLHPAGAQVEVPTSPPPPAPTTLDNRGLTPPQPMARTLEALKGLAPGATLVTLTDRQPAFLYEALADEGWRYETEAAEGGGFQTKIWKPLTPTPLR